MSMVYQKGSVGREGYTREEMVWQIPGLHHKLIIQGTAYEGKLFPGKVKTNTSWNAVPIPEDIRPIIEAWKQTYFSRSAYVSRSRAQRGCTTAAKNFLKMADSPHRRQAWHPEKTCYFSGDAADGGH